MTESIGEALDAFSEVIEAAARSRSTGGGQRVSYHGDFAAATPSVLRDLRYWDNRIRTAALITESQMARLRLEIARIGEQSGLVLRELDK